MSRCTSIATRRRYSGLARSSFEEKMRKCETRGGGDKTVESVRKYARTREIRILPELIKQRIVEPVVITRAVQIKESGANADGQHVR